MLYLLTTGKHTFSAAQIKMEKKMSKKFRCLVTVFALLFSNISKDVLATGSKADTSVTSVKLSNNFSLPFVRGVNFDPANPFEMNFIIDPSGKNHVSLDERYKILRYFLAALTIPDEKIWVNLSPYEKNRIIDETVASTEIGKTLLEQDYLLKQLSASLTHPETNTGRQYWQQPIQEIFSKIWIKPKNVHVYDKDTTVFISDIEFGLDCESDSQSVLIEPLTEQVNAGRNFARLRQMVYSIILAQWFKRKFARSLYNFYFNADKTTGLDVINPVIKEKIFDKYVEAFNKGAYGVTRKVRENGHLVKKRYFSGGAVVQLNNMQKKYDTGNIINRKFSGSSMLNQHVTAKTAITSTVLGSGLSYARKMIVMAIFGTLLFFTTGCYSVYNDGDIDGGTDDDAGTVFSFDVDTDTILFDTMTDLLDLDSGFDTQVPQQDTNSPEQDTDTSEYDFELSPKIDIDTRKIKDNRDEIGDQFAPDAGADSEYDFELPPKIEIDTQPRDEISEEFRSDSDTDSVFSELNGGIDLNGMIDGVKVYESSAAVIIKPHLTAKAGGVSFKLIGPGRMMPLNKILNLPSVI